MCGTRTSPPTARIWKRRRTQARKTLEANGIKFVSPSEADLAAVRQRMLPGQDATAKELRLSPALLQQVAADPALHGS